MKVKEFVTTVEQAVSTLQAKVESVSPSMCVMVGEGHVVVVKEHAIEGTTVNVRNVITALHATVFDNEDMAMKYGLDPYLTDYAGRPIVMKPMIATKFFAEEITKAEDVLATVKEICHEAM